MDVGIAFLFGMMVGGMAGIMLVSLCTIAGLRDMNNEKLEGKEDE